MMLPLESRINHESLSFLSGSTERKTWYVEHLTPVGLIFIVGWIMMSHTPNGLTTLNLLPTALESVELCTPAYYYIT